MSLAKADERWLMRSDNWGRWLMFPNDGATKYTEAFMFRVPSGQVRFFAPAPLRQVGPQHKSVVSATYWAFAQQWRDPEITAQHNIRCQTEVLIGGADRPFELTVSNTKGE